MYVTSMNCKYRLMNGTAYDDEKNEHGDLIYSFGAILFDAERPDQKEPELADLFHGAFVSSIEHNKLTITNIMRSRIGLIPAKPYPEQQGAHVDAAFPHLTALIYMNEADGDTVLYKDRYPNNSGINIKEYFEGLSNPEEEMRISPKPNRCVIFDGLQYHASTAPSKGVRIAINVNYQSLGIA
jgi:hypothetical protein